MVENDDPRAGTHSLSGAEGGLVSELPYVGFNQLRSFHAVALTGSVTRAAMLLHVGQPTVTTQLKQLESKYNVELVHRLASGIRLTDIGIELFGLTEQLFHIQASAVDLLSGARGELRGTLRVGGVAPHFLMDSLRRFAGSNPEVRLDVSLGDSNGILQRLVECDVDVAIVGHRGIDSRFVSRRLSRQEIVLVVAEGHPFAGRDVVSLVDLEDFPLIMRKGGSTSRRVLEDALETAGVTPRVVLEIDREGTFEAARAGLGVAVATTAETLNLAGLDAVPIAEDGLFTDALVVCRRDRQDAPLVAAFLEASGVGDE